MIHVMHHQAQKKNSGFTMIELLVAATIMALLAIIGIVNFSASNQRARDGKRKADLEQVRSALEMYRSDPANTNRYPAQGGSGNTAWNLMITALYNAGYISSATIVDPKGGAANYYTYSTTAQRTTYTVCGIFETAPTGMDCTGLSCCLSNP